MFFGLWEFKVSKFSSQKFNKFHKIKKISVYCVVASRSYLIKLPL